MMKNQQQKQYSSKRSINVLSHAKSVSVWQQEFSQIVERRTFFLEKVCTFTVKGHHKIGQKYEYNNLGTPRTENWPIVHSTQFFDRLTFLRVQFLKILAIHKFPNHDFSPRLASAKIGHRKL